MELSEFKKIIDKNLLEFLDSKINNLTPNSNKEILDIFNHLREISSEGKRIRPYIAYLSYKVSGGTDEKEAIKFFTFIEIFHLFCLIHDDIMDQADIRHGVSTIHKFISEKSNEQYGNSQAMLVGDMMLSWSHELLQNSLFGSSEIKDIQNIFHKMIDEVCVGQMLDLSLKNKKTATNEEIMQKMLLKTAGYSFTNPFLIGSALAGKKNDDFFMSLGKHLGLAFQIQDDIIDIEGGESNKTSFNDVTEHQPTLISNYVLENGTPEQKKLLISMFGNILSEEDKIHLRKLFLKSGAIEFGQKEIDLNIDKARKLIREQNNPSYKVFLDLISVIENRKN